jgi:hypothetical protein
MMRRFRSGIQAAVLLIVAGCAVQPEKALVVVPFDPAVQGNPSHRIDTKASSAHIYVYRAGMMSNLGHNHIVQTRAIHGELWLQPEERHSAFHLLLPVEAFTVDPPELRKKAGADFASVPSLADVQGTRNNMLGPKVLNAEQYPEIEIWSERIRGSGNSLTADIVVAVGGKLNRISIPINIEMAGKETSARGKFTVKQTDIGITPFSIMMGAVAVRDELEIEYTLTAVAVE